MRYILIVLVLISTSVFADDSTWLCIGEHGAEVNDKNGALNSDSFLNNEKWIITNDGLKYFGSDIVSLDTCNRDENGKPMWCEDSGGLWHGNFVMYKNNNFVLSGSTSMNKGSNKFYWVIGKCSNL